MLRRALLGLLALSPLVLPLSGRAADAPAEIKIGGLHASSGNFAAISMPVYSGMKLWADMVNAQGGVFVKPYNKKIPVKLISYDDQSNPATAATLTNQLITQDKVDILMADSGSVLTAVSVPIAREHKMLLFDPTGTGAAFFSKDNPYIVLLADPVSTIWPKYIADFLKADGAKAGIKKVALLYSTNDFTGTQATALRGFMKEAGSPLEIVFDQGVPTNTSNYTVILNNIAAANPDAVIALGYPGNDIAFLRNLQDGGQTFKFLFAVYPGLETKELSNAVGVQGLEGVFTYATPNTIAYKTDFGMNLDEYRKAWDKAYPNGKVEFGYNAIAGYTCGLIIEKALATTNSMEQLDLRKALSELSGKLNTLDGPFKIDEMGAQIGEITPLGQLMSDGKGGLKMVVVWPHDVATGQPTYGKP
jgi:branched-chain amino acid transport system substrate-binding protein